MDVIIHLDGESAVKETEDLGRWIVNRRLRAVRSVKQEKRPPAEGEQGPTILAILTVVLGAPAVVELAKAVQTWIETRKRSITIELAIGERRVSVRCDNPEDVQTIVEQVHQTFGA